MAKNVMLVWTLLLPLMIAVPPRGEAQTHVSLSAGQTSATLEGDDARRPFGEYRGEAVDLGDESGFFAGASLRVPLGGILSINPGLYFVQKGTTFKRDLQSGDVELSYIEVPLTIGVAVTGADRLLRVNLFAGPEISFEIDCDLEARGFSIDLFYRQFEDCTFSPDDDVEGGQRKSTDVGLVFGVEVSYRYLLLRGGLDMGLTSLDDSGADEDFRNSAWFLGAGILIGR